MLKDFYRLTEDHDKIKITSNYHTHTYLCGHAGGSVDDYVCAAVNGGLEVLGMSDHFVSPVPSCPDFIDFNTLETQYLKPISAAREKYGDRIKILSGAELEFFDGHSDHYTKLLARLDYLVLGQHEFYYNGTRYNSFTDGKTEEVMIGYFKSIDDALKTGWFSILAHPDLIFYCKPEVTRKIEKAFETTVRTAVDCGVALELNANGIRSHGFKYPTDLLIELCKKYNAKTVVSSDCHSPYALCDEYMRRLIDYAAECGLNVTNSIER